jgi:hypothetical protein
MATAVQTQLPLHQSARSNKARDIQIGLDSSRQSLMAALRKDMKSVIHRDQFTDRCRTNKVKSKGVLVVVD